MDITGLEFALNLRELSLAGNAITDISLFAMPLPGTTGFADLQHLSLDGNPLADLGPLANLTNLKRLSLDGALFSPATGIVLSDLSPLTSLNGLEWLSLADNRLTSITPLIVLSTLEHLDLHDNRLENIGAVFGDQVVDDNSVEFAANGNWLNNLDPTDAGFDDDYHFAIGTTDPGLVLLDSARRRRHATGGAGDATRAPTEGGKHGAGHQSGKCLAI